MVSSKRRAAGRRIAKKMRRNSKGRFVSKAGRKKKTYRKKRSTSGRRRKTSRRSYGGGLSAGDIAAVYGTGNIPQDLQGLYAAYAPARARKKERDDLRAAKKAIRDVQAAEAKKYRAAMKLPAVKKAIRSKRFNTLTGLNAIP